MKTYSHEQQLKLKEGLIKCKPTSPFAQILSSHDSSEHMVAMFFGPAPKGSILSYQSLEYEAEQDRQKQLAAPLLLPIGMLDDVPCVFEIGNDK